MSQKPVGRPKLHEFSSEKLEAFRRRLESAGLMRKEVLVTQETWDLVTAMAKESGVSVSDAASGLLEHGAKAYAAKKAKADAAHQPESSSAAPVGKGRSKVTANPIERFFIKRRELVQPSTPEADAKPR